MLRNTHGKTRKEGIFNLQYNTPTSDAFITRFDLESVGVSVEENEFGSQNNFILFPNPTDRSIFLKFQEDISGVLSMYNSLGEQVYATALEMKSLEKRSFDLSGLPTGIYLVTVIAGDQMFNQKFIKK